MKKFNLILLALLFVAMNATYAQKLKIGVVDVETIVKELPEAKKADATLQSLTKKYQDSLVIMQKSLQTRFENYQKQKGMMPADQLKKEEESLQMLDLQIKQYYEKKFGQMGEIIVKREKLLEPIRLKVKVAIEKVAKKEKINLILDKNQQFLLYSEDKFDITFRVLDQIKRNK